MSKIKNSPTGTSRLQDIKGLVANKGIRTSIEKMNAVIAKQGAQAGGLKKAKPK